jgi:hypothetical protein
MFAPVCEEVFESVKIDIDHPHRKAMEETHIMSVTRRYSTNLKCGGCLAKVAPDFNADSRLKSWSVDLAVEGKPLTVLGDLSREEIDALLKPHGFATVQELPTESPSFPPTEPTRKASFRPIILIAFYLAGGVALLELQSGGFEWMRAMARFMAGFFLVFSFFKLLDVSGFVSAFRMYDPLAKRSEIWAHAYPFVELSLGVGYLLAPMSIGLNVITFGVMSIGLIGVIGAVRSQRTIRCACLGTAFNLPMTTVTIIEDGLMATMALAMILVCLM